MAQRIEPDDSLDDFPTPSWGTRALIEHVLKPVGPIEGIAWEPACNRGYMARPLREYFPHVLATDVFDYGWKEMNGTQDFLFPVSVPPVDWVITNPPFRLAEQFVARALEVSRIGCVILVRLAFLEGGDRYQSLFRTNPPTIMAQFAERIILTKGIVRDPAKKYWDEEEKKWKRPSTATAYIWLVWVKGMERRPFQWIPPCRLKMERPGDYPAM